MPTPLRQTSGGLAPAHLASRQVLFAVIAAFSGAPTLIFLPFEVGFLAVWNMKVAKCAGAVIDQGAFDRTAADWKARSWS